MGRDKALLPFLRRPMVEIAVEKLRTFCAEVSISGNRDNLASFAPVVHETRLNAGPVAGIEAGLAASTHEWALFMPVDVPLIPSELLHNWAEAVLQESEAGVVAAFLIVERERQPAFCMWKRDCLPLVRKTVDAGHRRLNDLFDAVDEIDRGWCWPRDVVHFSPVRNPSTAQLNFWFSNVNTPQDLAEAEAWAEAETGRKA